VAIMKKQKVVTKNSKYNYENIDSIEWNEKLVKISNLLTCE
jgi:hypothetical protein